MFHLLKFADIFYFSSQVAHMAFEELNRKILFGKTLDLELVKGMYILLLG